MDKFTYKLAGGFQEFHISRRSSPAVCKFSVLLWLLLLLGLVSLVAAQKSTNTTSLWKTLQGKRPLVIAHGGFSGIFPDSSDLAYAFARSVSLSDVVLWCDVQLTKDNTGICFPYLTLDNGSNVVDVFPNAKPSTYPVNGKSTEGYFTVDFNLKRLGNIFLSQGVFNRPPDFNAGSPIGTVQEWIDAIPSRFWLNVEHDAFYSERNLSMRRFVISASKNNAIDFISSPELNFLKSIAPEFRGSRMKLVFRFLNEYDVEPSTNSTYGSLLKNLTFIKTFASGILVPKSYIWRVKNQYLESNTSLVSDAHTEGLQVFASEFANDVDMAYDYSYNPITEYLNFVDNGNFSVDGVLSDFPLTPSSAIDCFSHLDKKNVGKEKPLVISKEGASGDYPGCTDLAYKKAISDGVDVLDCPVQMTKDGIPFCMGSINLVNRTNVDSSPFSNRLTSIPGLPFDKGIFSFNLTWEEISQNISAALLNPFAADYGLYRNPKNKDSGKFMTLSDFLALANESSVPAVLIDIENAPFLAEKLGLSVADAVLDALEKAGYNNQNAKKVMIQSVNSSVLMRFKEKSNHERVYRVDEIISDVDDSAIEDIENFADSVTIRKLSVFHTDSSSFVTSYTDVVPKLQEAGFHVYVNNFNNEYISQPWDFLADATVEINTYAMAAKVDGIITSFPLTAVTYKKNRCLGLDANNTPSYMRPIEPGGLLQAISGGNMAPAEPPEPVLQDSEVVEPPLPSGKISRNTHNAPKIAPAPNRQATPPSTATSNVLHIKLILLLAMLMQF